MKLTYKTEGTCSSHIEVDVEEGIIKDVAFWGGCNGNLKGICQLIKGMKAEEVVEKLQGTRCGHRQTSCPDQLSKALLQAMGQEKQKEQGVVESSEAIG